MDINKIFSDLYDLDFNKLNKVDSESEEEYEVNKLQTESDSNSDSDSDSDIDIDKFFRMKYKERETDKDRKRDKERERETDKDRKRDKEREKEKNKSKIIINSNNVNRFNTTKPRLSKNPNKVYNYIWEYSNKGGDIFYKYDERLSIELTNRYINDEIYYNFTLHKTNYIIFFTTLKQISENGLIREIKLTKTLK